MSDERRIFTLGVDYEDGGRAPTYERQIHWLTYELTARRYFDKVSAEYAGKRCALIGPSGLILATRYRDDVESGEVWPEDDDDDDYSYSKVRTSTRQWRIG